jgi:hypothetical protein
VSNRPFFLYIIIGVKVSLRVPQLIPQGFEFN